MKKCFPIVVILFTLIGTSVYLIITLTGYVNYLTTAWSSENLDLIISADKYYYPNLIHFIFIICLLLLSAISVTMSALLLIKRVRGINIDDEERIKQRLVEKSEAKKQQKIAELKKQIEELEKDDQ